MKKWIKKGLLAILFLGVVSTYAENPSLKIAGALASNIRLIPQDETGASPIPVGRDPVSLEKGKRYLLVITKSGYSTYKKYFTADWTGLKEKGVQLERMVGPVTEEVWTADLEDNVSMEFVPISTGEFMMGSEEGEMDETPVHKVTIPIPFWMAKTEVTMQQYEQFKQVNHKPEPNEIEMPKGANYPVCWISWNDARDFCKWLTKKERRRGRLPEGYEYVLPTEAQWEYACRAGTTGDFSGNIDQMAWVNKNSGGKTNPVAKKKPNAWGLYDMHGNVWEWCDDIWYANYLNAPEDGCQRGDAPNEYRVDRSLWGQETERIYRLYNSNYRVIRGGGWAYSVEACRSSNRYYHTPDYTLSSIGFRPILIWNPPQLSLKVIDRLKKIPETSTPPSE